MNLTLPLIYLLSAPPAPAWTLALPAPDALESASTEARADDDALVRVEVTLAAGAELDQVATRWQQRAEDAGWVMLQRDASAWGWVATFEREGVRALAAIWPDAPIGTRPGIVHGYVELGRPRPAWPAPGPCLPLPPGGWEWYVHSHGTDQRGVSSRHSVRHVRQAHAAIDVDGDLVLDWLVPVGLAPRAEQPLNDGEAARCPEEMPWEVWVVRFEDGHACGHRLGEVGSGWLDADAWRAPWTGPLRDIVSAVEKTRLGDEGIPRLERTSSTFRFERDHYARVTRTSSSGVCHHCALWNCSPARWIE